MMDTAFDSSITATPMKTASETSPIGTQQTSGDAVNMLLAKLDEGTQTIINLRSILTLKTAELNELLAQLELTNQAITTVENTTTQIETMLKDFGLSAESKESLLINAEASLDSAIKTATSIYPQQFKQQSLIRRPSTASANSGSASFVEGNENKRLSNARLLTSRIRYKPDTKHILRKLNDLVRDLGLDSGKFFSSIGTTGDFEVLQRAYVDLDIAKTIALSAKSNMKRRNILMRSARRRNNMDEIQVLGDKIREGVALWTTYTRNTPLLINGEDIISILDREDDLLSKNLPIPSSFSYSGRPVSSVTLTPSTSSQTRNSLITANLSSETKAVVSPTTKRHSRIPSVSSSNTDISATIMTPASPSLVPSVPKKLQRQSGGARLTQVKANIGLPRVRTTSITQQKEQQNHHQQKVTFAATTTTIPVNSSKETKTPIISSANKPVSINTRPTHIPLPPSSQPTTPSSAGSDKKTLLKPPSQRGPGSTLRLRSMLAKRSQQQSPSKPLATPSTP